MSFNPLEETGIPLESQLRNWRELNVKPYDKREVHPYSRARGILLNGIEVEAVMFSHQMARNTLDSAVKKKLALVRRIEAQQQKAINWLIPGDESMIGRYFTVELTGTTGSTFTGALVETRRALPMAG